MSEFLMLFKTLVVALTVPFPLAFLTEKEDSDTKRLKVDRDAKNPFISVKALLIEPHQVLLQAATQLESQRPSLIYTASNNTELVRSESHLTDISEFQTDILQGSQPLLVSDSDTESTISIVSNEIEVGLDTTLNSSSIEGGSKTTKDTISVITLKPNVAQNNEDQYFETSGTM